MCFEQRCGFFDLCYIPDVGGDDVEDVLVVVVIEEVGMEMAIEMVDEMVVGSVEST